MSSQSASTLGKLAALRFEEAAQEHAVELTELLAVITMSPELQRRPLVLMGAYGLSQLEVAHACGCAVGTIKSRIFRGREKLK